MKKYIFTILSGCLLFTLNSAQQASADNEKPQPKKSWALLSRIFLNNNQVVQSTSYANYAMPSGSSTYFVTIIPKNSTYSFSGKLPKSKNIVFSSLTIYDQKGNIVTTNGEQQTWNMENTPNITNLKITNPNNEKIYYAMTRFYRESDNNDLSIFSTKNDNNYLLKVQEETNEGAKELPQAKLKVGKAATKILKKILKSKMNSIQQASPSESNMNKSFTLPSTTAGLFPNAFALYAIASPGGDAGYVKISGKMPTKAQANSKKIVFMSFMAVDYSNTQTVASISSKELGGFGSEYTFYIAKSEQLAEKLRTKYPNNSVLFWKKNIQKPGIVYRILGTKKPTENDLQTYAPTIEYFTSEDKTIK